MSFGKAVIATKVGGLPEVVDDCGILVPPRDPMALAKAMNALLADSPRRKELGRLARERAALYSWDNVAELQEKVYLQVADGK
jgi:glycosyltransferase involved in cell wall biosynthesis